VSGITPYLRALSSYPADLPEEYDHALETFLRLVSPRLLQSAELRTAADWRGIVDLWEPLFADALLDPSHPEWADKTWHRCRVRLILMHLLVAHVQSRFGYGATASEGRNEVRWSLIYLERLVDDRPFMPGPAGPALDRETAEISDDNLNTTLGMGAQWFDVYGVDSIAWMSGIAETEVRAIRDKLLTRL
jgi:hypothetical protein